MNIDDVFVRIGQFGSAQKKYFLVSTLTVAVFTAVATFNHQFVCWQPEFRCINRNGSALVNACYNDTVQACHSIVYHSPYSTVVTEWNLVCDEAWRPRLAQSAFMLGLVGSSLVSGAIADRYGRLRTLCWLSALAAPTIAAQALATDIHMYTIARLLNGLVHMGIVLSTVVLNQELVGATYRALVGNLNGCAFAIGLLLLAPLASFCYQWRHLMTVTATMSLMPPLLWLYIPQSPRWLIVRGRRQMALVVLRKIAAGNGRLLSPDDLSALQMPRLAHQSASRESTEDLFQLMKSMRGCLWILLLIIIWFTANLSYYGLTAASSTVGGSRFVNFAVSGLVDLPAHFLVYVTIDRFGRCRSISGCFLLTALFCSIVPVAPSGGIFGGSFNVRSFSLWSAKLCVAAVFTMAYVHTLEIFPTSVRNRGISLVNGSARLSGLIYPFMSTLYTVLCVLAVVCALLVVMLPETGGGQPLCSTVQEVLTLHSNTPLLVCVASAQDDNLTYSRVAVHPTTVRVGDDSGGGNSRNHLFAVMNEDGCDFSDDDDDDRLLL